MSKRPSEDACESAKKLKPGEPSIFDYRGEVDLDSIENHLSKNLTEYSSPKELLYSAVGNHALVYKLKPKYSIQDVNSMAKLQNDIHRIIESSPGVDGFSDDSLMPSRIKLVDYPHVNWDGDDMIFTINDVLDFGTVYEFRSGYIIRSALRTAVYAYAEGVVSNDMLIEPVSGHVFGVNVFGEGKFVKEFRVKFMRFLVNPKDYQLGLISKDDYGKTKINVQGRATLKDSRFGVLLDTIRVAGTVVSYKYQNLVTEKPWLLSKGESKLRYMVNDNGAGILGRILMVPRARAAYMGVMAPSLMSFMNGKDPQVTPYKHIFKYMGEEDSQPAYYNVVGNVAKSKNIKFLEATHLYHFMTFLNGGISWVPRYGQIKRILAKALSGPASILGLEIYKKACPNAVLPEEWEDFSKFILERYIDLRLEKEDSKYIEKFRKSKDTVPVCHFSKFLEGLGYSTPVPNKVQSNIIVVTFDKSEEEEK